MGNPLPEARPKRMNTKTIALLIVASWFCISASAARKITYDQAVRIALGESYTAKYFREEMDASRFSYLFTKAQFKPILDFNIFAPSWDEGVREISRPDGLPVYNSTGSLQVGGNINFTYVLPTGGNIALSSKMYWEHYRTRLSESGNRLLETNQAYSRFALIFDQPIFSGNKLRENMKAAELSYRKTVCYFTRTQMDIVYDVTDGFYGVYKLAYEHKINEDRLANSREAYRITRLKYGTGDLPEGELLITEITVAQDEARVMESRGRLETAKDEFKLLIGLDLKEEIDLEAEMDFEAFAIDLQRATDEALSNRKEIEEGGIDIELQQIEIKRAKRQRALKGNISGYYDLTGLSTLGRGSVGRLINSSFDNMSVRPPNRGVAFTLSYPIADWGRAKNLIRRTETQLRQMELNLDNTRRSIEQQIREIVRSVNEAEQRYRINRRNEQVAQKSYRISQMRFQNGDMTSQELSIEQERLSQVQLAFIESYITYRLSVADLNRKTMYDFENDRSFLLNNAQTDL